MTDIMYNEMARITYVHAIFKMYQIKCLKFLIAMFMTKIIEKSIASIPADMSLN